MIQLREDSVQQPPRSGLHVRASRRRPASPVFSGALFALLVLTALVASPRAALALNPPYLGQFPSVADVESKVVGSDPLDTAGRQAGSFHSLTWIVRVLSAGGEFGNKTTPDENALMSAYAAASERATERGKAILAAQGLPQQGTNSVNAKWLHEQVLYSDTDAFRRQTLAALAPSLVSLYEARKGGGGLSNLVPQIPSVPGLSSSSLGSRIPEIGLMPIAIGCLVVLALMLWRTHSRLVNLREDVRAARETWKIAELNRTKLEKKIENVVKQYAATAADPYVHLNLSGQPGIAAQAGAMISALQNFAERYPQLRVDHQYSQLEGQAIRLASEVKSAQDRLNAAVTTYNKARNQFPTFVFASLIGYGREKAIDIDVSQISLAAADNDFSRTPAAVMSAPQPQAFAASPPFQALPPGAGAPHPASLHGGYPAQSMHLLGGPQSAPAMAPQTGQHPSHAPARGGGTEAFQAVPFPMPAANIRFLSGPLSGQRWPVAHGVVIGREQGAAQIVVPDPQVSSGHAWIGLRGNALFFVDRGSTNGSIVNGAPVATQMEIPIKHGDVVTLGRMNSVSFVVETA